MSSKNLGIFVRLNNGLECLSNGEKVKILSARFCNANKGFMFVG